jgi:hypothetical protein
LPRIPSWGRVFDLSLAEAGRGGRHSVLGLCHSYRGRPTFGQTTVGRLCLHRPAPVLLGGVVSRLLAQPALQAEQAFLSSSCGDSWDASRQIARHVASPISHPHDKLPHDHQKYDGSQEPTLWLSDYLQAVQILGGTKATAMQCLQLHLTGAARSWLNTLPNESIGSWEN